MSANETKTNGWTAVPVSGKQIFQTRGDISTPTPVTVADVYFPSDVALVADAQAFVKNRLSPEAFNHSMRVFYWGMSFDHSGLLANTEHRSRIRDRQVTPSRARRRALARDLGTHLPAPRYRYCRGIFHLNQNVLRHLRWYQGHGGP